MTISGEEHEAYRRKSKAFFDKAGIILTEAEAANIEIADFGLGEFEQTGLALVTYINTDRVCAKELILFPGQTCPEHLHPSVLHYQPSQIHGALRGFAQ